MATKDELAEEWKIVSTGKIFSYAFGYTFINFYISIGLLPLYYFYQNEIFGPSGLAVAAIVTIMALSKSNYAYARSIRYL